MILMILMIILQMIHHIMKNVVKKKKPPLTLQQRKDRVISLTDIKGYNIVMDTYIKDGRPEEAIITFDSLLAREYKSSISPDVVHIIQSLMHTLN